MPANDGNMESWTVVDQDSQLPTRKTGFTDGGTLAHLGLWLSLIGLGEELPLVAPNSWLQTIGRPVRCVRPAFLGCCSPVPGDKNSRRLSG